MIAKFDCSVFKDATASAYERVMLVRAQERLRLGRRARKVERVRHVACMKLYAEESIFGDVSAPSCLKREGALDFRSRDVSEARAVKIPYC